MIVVACPDHIEDTDPKALVLAFHHQGHTFISAYCQAARTWLKETDVEVMICLNQGVNQFFMVPPHTPP